MALDELQQEVQLMMNQTTWKGHSLPVKRRQGRTGWECGFIINDGQPIVYKVNIFDVKAHLGRSFASLPQQRYGDFTSIVRDGWRVD